MRMSGGVRGGGDGALIVAGSPLIVSVGGLMRAGIHVGNERGRWNRAGTTMKKQRA